MSVCLLSSQLKDDFKWLESSLTKTERTALSHLLVYVIYKFLKQKDFFSDKERNIEEDVTSFSPAFVFLFQKILNSKQKINGVAGGGGGGGEVCAQDLNISKCPFTWHWESK